MGNFATLLAEQTTRIPELATYAWDVTEGVAVADLGRLAKIYTVYEPGKGKVLHVEPGPHPLAVINRLHAAGWKRGSLSCSTWGWTITATITEGDAGLRVQGWVGSLPDGTDFHDADPHSTMDYWSPAPPPLGRSKAAMALSREYMDRLRTGDWVGWTATEFPTPPAAAPSPSTRTSGSPS